ncbi:MAG: DUF2461 family protein, partial [Catalinimonas sp.]
MQHVLDFLARLRDHNDRDWFQAHKAEYQQAHADFAALVQDLIDRMAPWEPAVQHLTAKECLFRIYR